MDFFSLVSIGAGVVGKGIASNLPILRTVFSVVGTVVTPIWTGRSVLIAKDIIDKESQKRGGAPISKGECVELTWPHFVGPFLLGAFTVYNEIENTRDLLGKVSAATAAAALSNKALEQYKNKNKELFGNSNDRKIESEIAEDKVKALSAKYNGNSPVILGGEKLLFMDAFSGRPFRSTIQNVRKAVNDINESLIPGGTWSSENQMTLNDFYASIDDQQNLGMLEAGYHLGWLTKNSMKYDIEWKQYNESTVIGVLKYNLYDLTSGTPVLNC